MSAYITTTLAGKDIVAVAILRARIEVFVDYGSHLRQTLS